MHWLSSLTDVIQVRGLSVQASYVVDDAVGDVAGCESSDGASDGRAAERSIGQGTFAVLASGRFAGLATQPTNGVSGQACHAPTRLSPPQRWSACLRRWSASSTTIVRNQVGLRARPSGPRAWGSARDSATNSDSSRFAQSMYAPDGTGPDHQGVEPPDERRHFCASADFGLDGRPLSPHRGTARAFRRAARLASASPESAS